MSRPKRARLLENIFTIRRIGEGLYRCDAPQMCGVLAENRVFGGQAVAQAMRAVQEHLGRNVVPSTMYYRFIAPGRGDFPLDYSVEELGDIIRVTIFQNEKLIGTSIIRLTKDQFPSFPLELDYISSPTDQPDLQELSSVMGNVGVNRDLMKKQIIYDIRPIQWGIVISPADRPKHILWSRIQRDSVASIPVECGIQSALLLSDFLIIQIAEDIYSSHGYSMTSAASLSHSVRFHKRNEEIDPHGWFLYRVECEYIGKNRCLLKATIYNEDRMAVLTITQEANMTAEWRKGAKL